MGGFFDRIGDYFRTAPAPSDEGLSDTDYTPQAGGDDLCALALLVGVLLIVGR